jgi:hypothetical protein
MRSPKVKLVGIIVNELNVATGTGRNVRMGYDRADPRDGHVHDRRGHERSALIGKEVARNKAKCRIDGRDAQ